MNAIDKSLRWFVVRSKPIQERKALRQILQLGFAAYFPQRRVEYVGRRNHKTFKVVDEALMTGYLFVGFKPALGQQHFGKVNKLDSVEYIVGAKEDPKDIWFHPIAVPAEHVDAIYRAEDDLAFDDTRQARIHRGEELPDGVTRKSIKEAAKKSFPVGSQVNVKSGELDLFGFISQHTTSGRVKVAVEGLAGTFMVDADPENIRSAA